MKQPLFTVFVLVCIGILTNGCQRDDICPEATPTTPRLVISFLDQNNIETPKNVPLLSVNAIGVPERIPLNDDGDVILTTDTISIPLDPSTTTVDYNFVMNSDETNQNIDVVQFSYTPQDDYINRACGFRSTYLDLQFSFDFTDTENNWIQNIQILESNINDELVTHVTIFH